MIALKYEGEEEYRYIYATRLAWCLRDIIRVYGLRWLIEVYFQDCKAFEGLGELQLLDVEGSERAATLSLLFDSSLFFQEEQVHLIENKLPVYTIGSLLEKRRLEAFLLYFRNILESEEPLARLKKLEEGIESIYELRPSKKHMSGIEMGEMEARNNALKYRAREEGAAA